MSPEITARPSKRFLALKLANRVIQWCSLFFLGEWALYGIFRCPFVVPFVSCQNCPIITCPGRAANFFWGVWAGWIALALFCGRLFCGWLCPGGLVQRILGKNPLKTHLQSDAERVFGYGKYLVLLFALLAYFCMFQPRINVPIRVGGEFWHSVWLTFNFAFPMWLFRTGLVVVLLVLSLFVVQAWCRFACPAGGLLELTKHFALVRVYKTDECNNCDKCRRACYMHTRPDEIDCTSCGDCLDDCPQGCIHIGRKKS